VSIKNSSPGQDRGWYRRQYLRLRSILFDRTTALPSFPVLFHELRTMLEDHKRIGVLHIEIDHLALVESLYGWQVFDRVLSHVAAELQDAVGDELPEGTLLGLSGIAGDRFIAFVPGRPDGSGIDGSYLEAVAARLTTRLKAIFDSDSFVGLSPKLEFRAGHSMLSQNPFYRFERRVYAAIEKARSYDELRRRRRETAWGEELQSIIKKAAVDTLFQPVIDLRSGALLGYEAFSRGPKDSPLEMPREMFATSNRIGLSDDLDSICRDSALRASADVEEKGKIFLNILPSNASELESKSGKVLALLQALALDPEDLVLEFSERGADEDPEAFVSCLERLKELGFNVALDDVGTGYASQAILERLRPDYLKLDVSLVHNINEHLIKQELLQSLIRIAERIGAAVIAEGIETEEEAATLVQAGTQYGQGFLYALPVPAAELGQPSGAGSTDMES
jgi:EAL domain-containing protein (putative c-di-GMP-specific phosphodiesterase class I)/GGDEF domain-containing protein